jgi:hypothetical protein
MFFKNRLQNQREPSAESLLYAEVKPDFARGFFKTACKGTINI